MTSVIGSNEPSELELNPDDNDNDFPEIKGYMSKESIADVNIGLVLMALSVQKS